MRQDLQAGDGSPPEDGTLQAGVSLTALVVGKPDPKPIPGGLAELSMSRKSTRSAKVASSKRSMILAERRAREARKRGQPLPKEAHAEWGKQETVTANDQPAASEARLPKPCHAPKPLQPKGGKAEALQDEVVQAELPSPDPSPEDSPLTADPAERDVSGNVPEAIHEEGQPKDVDGFEDPARRREMIGRLYHSFVGQMTRLEHRLRHLETEGGDGADLGEIDRTVKTLASLARTLTVLLGLQAEAERAGKGPEKAAGKAREGMADGGELGSLDPDDLRRTLAQRLERLCSAGAAAGSAELPDADRDALSAQ